MPRINDQDDREGIYIYAIREVRNLLKIDFVRFCLVGGVGFLVNLGVLTYLFEVAGWSQQQWQSVGLAQIIGGEVALLSNFTFHHFWTYRERARDKRKRLLLAQFHLSYWSGFSLNLLAVVLITGVFHIHYIFGLIVGSAIGLFWNFFWTKFYIWHHKPATLPGSRRTHTKLSE